MSLLSLSLFASVCLIIEPIHVMFVQLDAVASARHGPFCLALEVHIVFLLFVLLAQCPKHATTSFVLLTVSLSRADVRRLGVRPFAYAHHLW